VTLAADGRILVAGTAANGTDDDFGLARYQSDGTLDPDFGSDGRVRTDFGSGDDRNRFVGVDAQGRIISAGQAFDGTDFDFALARYLP